MKILLPVDGSGLSLHEVRFALRLVKDGLKASFVLANVQEPASFYEIITARNDARMLESVQQEAGADMVAPSVGLLKEAGVPFDVVVLAGDPAPAMLELIEEHRCDMVVMGSRALGPVRRWLEGGSTSQRLVQSSPVPVLLVTPPASDET